MNIYKIILTELFSSESEYTSVECRKMKLFEKIFYSHTSTYTINSIYAN